MGYLPSLMMPDSEIHFLCCSLLPNLHELVSPTPATPSRGSLSISLTFRMLLPALRDRDRFCFIFQLILLSGLDNGS